MSLFPGGLRVHRELSEQTHCVTSVAEGIILSSGVPSKRRTRLQLVTAISGTSDREGKLASSLVVVGVHATPDEVMG